MRAPGSRLVLLLQLVDRIPLPAPERRRRGRPPRYSDRVFLKALVGMVVRHLHRPGERLAVLDEPTAVVSREVGAFEPEAPAGMVG